MSCVVCGVTSNGGQYCVGCGQPLRPVLMPATTSVAVREAPRPPRNAWLSLQEIRLLACPKCGAPNSAARWHCARCGTSFDEQDADDAAPVEGGAPSEDAAAVPPEAAPWLTLITVVAGVAVVAVAAVMLASRGVGPFEEPDTAAVAQATSVPIGDVEASSAVDADSGPGMLIDGDPGTAWRADADGAEWIELEFDEPARVDHLLVWNGDQVSDASFAGTNRVTEALIIFPDVGKGYRAEFEDIDDNFRIDIPDAPTADRIHIEVVTTHGGHDLTALSEIEALASTSPVAE